MRKIVAEQTFTINDKMNTNNADVILSYDHDDAAATYYFFDAVTERWLQVYKDSTYNDEGETWEINFLPLIPELFIKCFTTDLDDEHWILRQISKKAIQVFMDSHPHPDKEYLFLFRQVNPEGYTDYLEETIAKQKESQL
jgi:hypothetical protein